MLFHWSLFSLQLRQRCEWNIITCSNEEEMKRVQTKRKDWSLPKHRTDGNEHSVTAPLAVLAVEVSVNARPGSRALCTAWARHLAFPDTEYTWEMSTAITNITACTWQITHETPLWLCTEPCRMVLLYGNNRCTGNTLKFWSSPPPQICVWTAMQGMWHCKCFSLLINLVHSPAKTREENEGQFVRWSPINCFRGEVFLFPKVSRSLSPFQHGLP